MKFRATTPCRWLMFGSIPFILLLLSAEKEALGQKLNRNRPSVYLTFKGFVPKTAEDYPTQGARLVLHNNTRWPIYFGEWLDIALSGDVPMIYAIELNNGCLEERKHVEVVRKGKVMPGKTVSFVVPKGDFPKGSKIYVGFWYSWEFSPAEIRGEETVHRAYFYSSDAMCKF